LAAGTTVQLSVTAPPLEVAVRLVGGAASVQPGVVCTSLELGLSPMAFTAETT
jgi:hypothetical protein